MNIDLVKTYVIKCSKCGDEEEVDYDNVANSENYFKSQGWQELDGKTLCPDCAEYFWDQVMAQHDSERTNGFKNY